MAPVRYDSMDRAVRYDTAAFPPVGDVPRPVAVQDYRPGAVQRPDVLDRHAVPAVADPDRRPTAAETVAAAVQRQSSGSVQSGMTSGVERPSPAADPLRYVKTDMSPLAEEARLTIGQLQRQKPHDRHGETGHDEDTWQAVCHS